MTEHEATQTGLTLLERLDMMSWELTRSAAARIRELEGEAEDMKSDIVKLCEATSDLASELYGKESCEPQLGSIAAALPQLHPITPDARASQCPRCQGRGVVTVPVPPRIVRWDGDVATVSLEHRSQEEPCPVCASQVRLRLATTMPRDPTPDMIDAGIATLRQSTRSASVHVSAVWRAMWDAANAMVAERSDSV